MSRSNDLLRTFEDLRDQTVPTSHESAGLVLSSNLTSSLDRALVSLVSEAESREGQYPLAVFTHGSTGRGEQTRFSDIDLMIIVGEGQEQLASEILYPLWDMNFKIGHSVREIKDLQTETLGSIETATSLIDARFVAGSELIWQEFQNERQRIFESYGGEIRAELARSYFRQCEKQPWQTLAIDIKSGRGGLRSLSTIRWLNYLEISLSGVSSAPVNEELLGDALSRLLSTRNALHAIHGKQSRTVNLLHPDIAQRVGDWLGVDPVRWQQSLFTAMRSVDKVLRQSIHKIDSGASYWTSHESLPSIGISDDDASRLNVFLAGIDRITERMQRGELDPLPVDDSFLEELPEWEPLRARPHRVSFHTHPIDVHNARAVLEAKKLISEGDQFSEEVEKIFSELSNGWELLVAVFLHDIGKGRGRTHSPYGAELAAGICDRFGIDPSSKARIVKAVRHHLLLPETATRRDISDENVLADIASLFEDVETLNLLYLVTVADARATGGTTWSRWRAQLITALYLRIKEFFDSGGSSILVSKRNKVLEDLKEVHSQSDVIEHLDLVDEGYLLGTTSSLIGLHIEQCREAMVSQSKTSLRFDSINGIDRFSVVMPDRTGLIRDIAGSLAGANMSVFSGVAYTRLDGLAIQVWHVADALGNELEASRWGHLFDHFISDGANQAIIEERVSEILRSYPAGTLTGTEPSVVLDNESSDQYTILEVSTTDRATILYQITRALSTMNLNIHLAKVDSIGNLAVDTFYLSKSGKKLSGFSELTRLQDAVYIAIEL